MQIITVFPPGSEKIELLHFLLIRQTYSFIMDKETTVLVKKEEDNPNHITMGKYVLMTIILYLCVFIDGLVDTIRSVAYPLMKNDLNLSYTQYGVLQSMTQLTYLFGALSTAFGMEYLGFKTPLVISFILSLIGCVGTAFSHNFAVVLVSQFFAGCVFGALDDGPSSIAIILFTKHPAALFCIMAGVYGFGSFIGPGFAQKIYDLYPKYSYGGIYLAFCIPLAIVGLIVMCTPFPIKKPIKLESPEDLKETNTQGNVEREKDSIKKKVTAWSCITSPLLWYCATLLCLMSTAERGTLNWGSMYVRDVLHLPEVEGTKLNSRFYFMFMISRFICGFITDRIGPFTMEYIIIPIGMIIYVVGFMMKAEGLYVLPFVGFFVTLYWPTFLMCCKQYWKEESAIPIACMLPMQSIVGMLVQFLLGVINDKFGPQFAYWMSVPAGITAMLMLMFFQYLIRKKNQKEAASLVANEV